MTQTNPLEEASAFFALFLRSAWESAHVRTPEIEIFVARRSHAPNPMTMAASGSEPDSATAASGAELRAPHLGTVMSLAAIGTTLAAGECYARLELLGETIELSADEGGTVAGHLMPIGALAEYDKPLVRLH